MISRRSEISKKSKKTNVRLILAHSFFTMPLIRTVLRSRQDGSHGRKMLSVILMFVHRKLVFSCVSGSLSSTDSLLAILALWTQISISNWASSSCFFSSTAIELNSQSEYSTGYLKKSSWYLAQALLEGLGFELAWPCPWDWHHKLLRVSRVSFWVGCMPQVSCAFAVGKPDRRLFWCLIRKKKKSRSVTHPRNRWWATCGT